MYTTVARQPTRHLVPIRGRLADSEIEIRERLGLRVTTLERTIVDCLARFPAGEAEGLWA
ncbi:hypothetical protein [Occultella gossypii]|uniref:Uncharacterized protein n=1 Tax=Occultella gossypii TaxID=2800820 RepID=A0ABS7S7S8_9MICO|nr:hypothetical protein [Occultella gossypii]MBZ2196395.1 hypothetical protein [Occultella gossypii]